MEAILWDEEKGAWFDYDLEKGKRNLEFYPSNLTPLWAGCFSDPSAADRALKYLEVRGRWVVGRPAWHPGGADLPSLRAQGPWLLLHSLLLVTSKSGIF